MKALYLFLGILLCCLLFLSENAFSQVTIGSNVEPHKDAILDLKQDGITKGGLLLPRVALVESTSSQPLSIHTEGMTVYNTAKTGDVTPGFYYNNGSKWLKLYSAEDSFFYMPSVVLPTDENDPAFTGGLFTIDLHAAYSKQFGLSATNVAVSDNSAHLPVYRNDELYYFITYYDDDVFDDVKVNSSGVLTYKLKTGFRYSAKTFMNIVLKAK